MINIILAEDHLVVRNGIKLLIDSQENLSVIGEANNGEEALELLAAGAKPRVNGAAIGVETDAHRRLANPGNFLFGKQLMGPQEATTPGRRIYFALQTVHVGTLEGREAALRDACYFIDMFAAETTSHIARNLLAQAKQAAETGHGYQALRLARRIIRHEDAVLSV